MKRKWCLIRTNGDLVPGSFVYVVWVGSSLRESELFALVECFCKDCGWYFRQWSANVDSALLLRSKISRADGTKAVQPYQMISLSIAECYQTILDDSWANLEANRVMSPQEKYMRFHNDPKFLMAYNKPKRNTLCPPSNVKTYVRKSRRQSVNVALNLLAILLLLVLDAVITNIFHLL